ncbi:MFS transporter [Phaeacidiphilus oryzae]|uniref:MFS transporter n=1 Tax=Phaeacidiphilus oryzae TaxID=348818 RepID=UPI001377F1FD|nr:MFS transporter [Phaeacidiphilus oryzae]
MIATVVGAFPLGMFSLAILLFVRDRTGSLAEAGLAVGVFGVGNAVGLILQGRLIDRIGQSAVLAPAGLVCAAGSVLLVTAASAAGSMAFRLVVTGGLGCAIPATTGSMRVLLGETIAEPETRIAGYALLAVAFQLALLTGPLVTAALLAPVGPGGAVVTAGALAGVAGVLFAVTGASRAWRPHRAHPAESGYRMRRGLVALLLVAAGGGLSAGLFTVAVPAAALAHGAAAESGPLIAMSAAGEIVGATAFGARRRRGSTTRHLLVALTGSTIAAGLVACVSDHITWLFPAALFAGTCSGPFAITVSALLDTVAPRTALTRSYTLMVSVSLLAGSLGSSAGGAIVSAAGYRLLFTVNACWLACLLAIGVLVRRAFTQTAVTNVAAGRTGQARRR